MSHPQPLPVRGWEVGGVWLPDEDGSLRREARRAAWRSMELGAEIGEIQSQDALADQLAGLEWQDELDRRGHEADTHGWRTGSTDELQARAERSDAGWAVGLVPVPTTQKSAVGTGKRKARALRLEDLPAASQAAVQAVGGFVPDVDLARMAKLRRAVGFTARAHGAARKGHRPDEVRMLTLTYRDGVKWEANHVRALMDHVRKWHKRHGMQCRYTWVAEIQDGKRRQDGEGRGAVHYHVAMWVPQGAPHLPKPDKEGWWPHGSTRIELAKGAVQYLMSYLKKDGSKDFHLFPAGCRLYSVGGLEHSMRRARRWLGLPGFVKGNSSALDQWERTPGGGWTSPQGEWFPSEFRRIKVCGVNALQRVHQHGRVIDAAGPFMWLSDRDKARLQAAPH